MPGILSNKFLAAALLVSALVLAGCAGEETRPPTAIPTGTLTRLPTATQSLVSNPFLASEPTATRASTAVPVVTLTAIPTAAPTRVPVPTVSVLVPTPDFVSSMPLSGPVSSSAIAVSPDGAMVAAVNPDSDSITLMDAVTLEVIEEVPVGDDPRTLSFTPDSRALLVANQSSANVAILDVARPRRIVQIPVGSMPYGVVTDGQHAFIAEFALGNLAVIDLSDNSVVKRLPVGPFPAGLALLPWAPDDVGDVQGGLLLVAHFFNGQVTVVDLATLSVVARASTGLGTNLSQFLVVGPETAKVYLPQTRSNSTNTALTFDTTVFPVVNVLDLNDFSLLTRDRITIDTADQPANSPFAAALSPDESRLFVVHAGSDNVSVIDLAGNQGLGNIDVGANPRGIAITPDGSTLLVNNVLDGTVSVIDANTLEVTNTIGLTKIPLSAEVL